MARGRTIIPQPYKAKKVNLKEEAEALSSNPVEENYSTFEREGKYPTFKEEPLFNDGKREDEGLLYYSPDKAATTPRISNAISSSIARRSDPHLFDNLPASLKKSWEDAGFNTEISTTNKEGLCFRDINGKEVNLSSSEMELIEILSLIITGQLEAPDIKAHHKKVIEPFLRGDYNGKADLERMEVTRNFKLEDLCKIIYRGADTKSMRQLAKDLYNISNARAQAIRIERKDKEGKTHTIFSTKPFITIGEQVFYSIRQFEEGKRGRKKNATDNEKEEEKILVAVSLTFHPIFFLKTYNYDGKKTDLAFCPIKPSISTICPKRNDLFWIVLFLLQSIYSQRITKWKKVPYEVKKEYKDKANITSEELGSIIIETQNKALIYREKLSTLDSRLPKPFGKNKKRLIAQLTDTIKRLKEYGIISEGNTTREEVVFVINPNFVKEDILTHIREQEKEGTTKEEK